MSKLFCVLLCCLLLCGCSTINHKDNTSTTEATSSAPANTTIPSELTTITVYVPNDNFDGFDTVEVTGNNLSALEAMAQAGTLPENIVINSFSQSGDTLTVDFGAEFRSLVNNQGSTGEYLIMGSVVNTLITLHNVKYVQITVDGDVLESGHIIYDFPMEFYD